MVFYPGGLLNSGVNIMANMQTEALRIALEALESYKNFIEDAHIIEGQWHWIDGADQAITAIKQALAAPVQEPVAWCTKSDLENMAKGFSQDVPARSMRVPQLYPEGNTVLLYTTPSAQPAPVQEPVATLLAAIQAEPVTLIHKWRVLELVKEHAAQPAPVQEPVAVCHDDGYWTPLKTEAGRRFNDLLSKAGSRINVYTTSPAAQRQWVGLTDEQREEIAKGWRGRNWTVGDIIDAVEAAHGITEKGGAA